MLISIIIVVTFITVIEITKNKFNKYFNAKTDKSNFDEEEYKKQEFKFIATSTLTYTIILLITLTVVSQPFKSHLKSNLYLEDYRKYFLETLIGASYTILLNSLLYLGFLVQLLLKIENLKISDKETIFIIKENIYGPLLEEILYRGIIFNLLREGGNSPVSATFISSLLFGLCKFWHNLSSFETFLGL